MVDFLEENLNMAENEAENEDSPLDIVEDDSLAPSTDSENSDIITNSEEISAESQSKDNIVVGFFKSIFSKKSPAGRIWEIDFLRGFCVFLMIIDHIAIMLATEFGPAWFGWNMEAQSSFGAKLCSFFLWYCRDSSLRAIGHPIVVFIFFAISGISCSFSRSNLKRGLTLAVISILYTLVTYILSITIDNTLLVTFGVLHFYAFCILAWEVICRICKNNKIAKTIVSGFIVILVAVLYYCYKAPASTPQWLFWIWPRRHPDGTYSLFYQQGLVSPGDLFNLIPYASFFFAGTFLQPLLYSKRRSLLPKLDRGWHRPFTFLGRNAISVYLTHIILVAVILSLISYIIFGTWGLF